MRVSVHFDTNSNEFAYFARTGQLTLGPPPLTPVNSFRPPSFQNLQPHPSIVEFPRQPMSVNNNDGWNPAPQPLPPGVQGWGYVERKDQPILPPLSAFLGNVFPVPPHDHFTEASSSASRVHSPHPYVPIQLDNIDQPIHVEQQMVEVPVEQPVVVLSNVVDLPLVEEVSVVPVTTELKPSVRPVTLSQLSLFPNIFQHLHDFGLF